jgi:hypothetical protein
MKQICKFVDSEAANMAILKYLSKEDIMVFLNNIGSGLLSQETPKSPGEAHFLLLKLLCKWITINHLPMLGGPNNYLVTPNLC